jgi:hypothetical protein
VSSWCHSLFSDAISTTDMTEKVCNIEWLGTGKLTEIPSEDLSLSLVDFACVLFYLATLHQLKTLCV